jgi:hypothetical protein
MKRNRIGLPRFNAMWAAEGEGDTSWLESLPEAMRDAPFIGKADSLESAMAEIQNAAAHMGNSIRIPSEEAGTEDVAKFYAKIQEKAPNLMVKPDITNAETMSAFYRSIGQPENATDYKYEMPEGKEMPTDFQNFAVVAHKFGLTQAQFEGMMGDVLGTMWEGQSTMEGNHKNEIDELGTEWGQAFKTNMSIVENYLNLSKAPTGIIEMFKEGTMSADEISWLHSVATTTKSATELSQQHSDQQVALTPAAAQDQIQEIMNNRDHPYFKPADPRNKQAIKRMIELQSAAHPEASVNVNDLRANAGQFG